MLIAAISSAPRTAPSHAVEATVASAMPPAAIPAKPTSTFAVRLTASCSLLFLPRASSAFFSLGSCVSTLARLLLSLWADFRSLSSCFSLPFHLPS